MCSDKEEREKKRWKSKRLCIDKKKNVDLKKEAWRGKMCRERTEKKKENKNVKGESCRKENKAGMR